MPEQDDFIGFLRDVPSYVNSNNVGQPYTSYVPFVLKLFPGHIKDYNMVSFFFLFCHTSPFSEILWPYIKYNALLSILLLCFQQRIPAACIPTFTIPQGELTVVSTRSRDVLFKAKYSSESGEDGSLKIQGWKRIINRMNIKQGDTLFSILHNGMWGVYWFFFYFTLWSWWVVGWWRLYMMIDEETIYVRRV
jgi:hypothetical protein